MPRLPGKLRSEADCRWALKQAGLKSRCNLIGDNSCKVTNPKTGNWILVDLTEEDAEEVTKQLCANFEKYWQVTIGQHIES